MGRPIQKKYFSVKAGSQAGDLSLTTLNGVEKIINQKGTGVYTVPSGRVKLVDTGGLGEGEAHLTFDDGSGVKYVRKITQYRMDFFGGGSASWRDSDGALESGVTLNPPLVDESERVATATVTVLDGAITGLVLADGGSGYPLSSSTIPVTISAANGTSATVGTYDGAADGSGTIEVLNGGGGYTSPPIVTYDSGGAGTGATFTANLTNGVVTSITGNGAGSGYDGDEAYTIAAVTKTDLTGVTANSDAGGVITSFNADAGGAGYVSATATVANPY